MNTVSIVSIIVPIYNAELYLKDCIQSILKQSYKNIEIILINDGSTDTSGEICEKFAKKDSRIRVIHQKNSGVSSTRNKGIELARGKYIQFVDSDDTIDSSMTETLINNILKGNQWVLSGFKMLQIEDGNIVASQTVTPSIEGVLNKEELLTEFGFLFKQSLINPLWNKLYISDLVKKNNVRFNKSISMGEDLLFNLNYLRFCEEVIIIKEPLYIYNVVNNVNSLTSSYKTGYFENQNMLFEYVRDFLLKNDVYTDKNKRNIEEVYTNSIVGCLNNLFHKESNSMPSEIKRQIHKIINFYKVRENIYYFKFGSMEKLLIGFLIKLKLVEGLYILILTKKKIQYKLTTLYRILKKINQSK